MSAPPLVLDEINPEGEGEADPFNRHFTGSMLVR
jgi:hypothetical protein